MLDIELAHFMAEEVNRFREEVHSEATFVASHGVTIFHQPQHGLTTQLGSGAVLASLIRLPTISDFRQQDVTKGGQGAPLVPSCDRYLFSDYSATLNLGGFANLTLLQPEFRGMDVCGCNVLLNHVVNEIGKAYDEGGRIAEKGVIIEEMLAQLNALSALQGGQPHSLGMEWFSKQVLPTMRAFESHAHEDRLRTIVEHIAIQIGKRIPDAVEDLLVAGGGAHNHFLMERISALCGATIVVPSAALIDFKEAICFAFLGLRRMQSLPNISSETTGSKEDSCAGALYLP